jgi:membrane-bound lytic murein transglycosylase MltF
MGCPVQTVQVRQINTYYQRLQALNATFAQQEKPPIVVNFVPDTLEDEDILEMVNAGLVKITIVDHAAGVEAHGNRWRAPACSVDPMRSASSTKSS